MKKLIVLAAAVSLSACNGAATDEASDDATEAEAPAEAMSLNGTSWTYAIDGTEYSESIDADGNYVTNAGDQHADHGTYVMTDGKHCFTSAMNEDGEMCWTTPDTVAVGESVTITSDAGDEMTVTRQENADASASS